MNVLILQSFRRAGTAVRVVWFETSASNMDSWFADFKEDGTLIHITDGDRKFMRPELSAYLLRKFRAKFDEALANVPEIGCWKSPRSRAIEKANEEFVGYR